jgi:hypothetical protein
MCSTPVENPSIEWQVPRTYLVAVKKETSLTPARNGIPAAQLVAYLCLTELYLFHKEAAL